MAERTIAELNDLWWVDTHTAPCWCDTCEGPRHAKRKAIPRTQEPQDLESRTEDEWPKHAVHQASRPTPVG